MPYFAGNPWILEFIEMLLAQTISSNGVTDQARPWHRCTPMTLGPQQDNMYCHTTKLFRSILQIQIWSSKCPFMDRCYHLLKQCLTSFYVSKNIIMNTRTKGFPLDYSIKWSMSSSSSAWNLFNQKRALNSKCITLIVKKTKQKKLFMFTSKQ